MTSSAKKFAWAFAMSMSILIVAMTLLFSALSIFKSGTSPTKTAAPISQQAALDKWLSGHDARNTQIFDLGSWKKGDENVTLQTYGAAGVPCTTFGTLSVDLKTGVPSTNGTGSAPFGSCLEVAPIEAIAGSLFSVDLAAYAPTAPGFQIVAQCGQIDFVKSVAGYIYETTALIAPRGSICGQYALTVRWAK
jgi:hypothetical protein